MSLVTIVYALVVFSLFIIGLQTFFIKGFRNGRVRTKKTIKPHTGRGLILLFIVCGLFPLSLLFALAHSVWCLKLKWDKTKYRHYFDFKGRTVYVDKRGNNGQYLLTEKNYSSSDYTYDEYMKKIRTELHPHLREEYTKIMLEEVYPYLDELARRNFLKAIR